MDGKERVSSKNNYHHGNLRETLLAAASELLQEAGVDAVGLRAVARRAGVSAGAPYRHFEDKAALLGALIERCFLDLDHASRAALVGGLSPQDKLKAIGVAYVMYAVSHPAEFKLMFRPEKGSLLEAPDVATMPVYGVLLEVVDELHAQGKGGERQADVITAWSLVHGLAALLVDGPLQPLSRDRVKVRDLAETVTSGLLLVN